MAGQNELKTDLKSSRILVIDDDDVAREILGEILEKAGFSYEAASNGRIGIRLHREKPFNLIITDIIMPDMEGIETMQELRHISPTVKIIAVSGGGHLDADNYLIMAKKLGAQLTFAKPFDPQKLVQGITDLLAL